MKKVMAGGRRREKERKAQMGKWSREFGSNKMCTGDGKWAGLPDARQIQEQWKTKMFKL